MDVSWHLKMRDLKIKITSIFLTVSNNYPLIYYIDGISGRDLFLMHLRDFSLVLVYIEQKIRKTMSTCPKITVLSMV